MLALQRFQSKRLQRDHADLAQESQYVQIGKFFFDEIYGPHDFTNRDQQAHRLHQFLSFVPGIALRDIEPILQLLELSNRLDNELLEQLLRLNAPLDFDEALYNQAYILADAYAERIEQLNLIRSTLYTVFRTNTPLTRMALERTEALAAIAGMAEIHRFLRLGLQAIQPVKDIYRFVETIYLREKDRLDRLYGKGGK